MKRNVCLFIAILSIISCKSQEFRYSDDSPNESDLAIIDIQLGNDKNLLTFVDDFENDSISLFSDDTLIFEGKISTDPTLGASKGLTYLRNTKYLCFYRQ